MMTGAAPLESAGERGATADYNAKRPYNALVARRSAARWTDAAIGCVQAAQE